MADPTSRVREEPVRAAALAVTPQQVPLPTEMSIYGGARLPVTW
ncbi:MAG TPA: hypothetical protein VLJ88_15155 [Propionibacteriaceae bacterium]|nr:hypothetical protein [Propionibacteriaceae bacterium]